MPDDRSLDLLGIKPLADAALVVVKGSVEGAGAFLGRICLPAAEEFGLLLRDKVSAWRSLNATIIANKAEQLLSTCGEESRLHAHPRIVGKVLEQGSWENDERVQQMWAGLLASACTKGGDSQDNLIFINLLEQITSAQALLISYACSNLTVKVSRHGLIMANEIKIDNDKAVNLLGTNDIQQADIELDHLREIGLLTPNGGFDYHSDFCDITPAALGLHFYARCQGYRGLVTEFFPVEEATADKATQTVAD